MSHNVDKTLHSHCAADSQRRSSEGDVEFRRCDLQEP